MGIYKHYIDFLDEWWVEFCGSCKRFKEEKDADEYVQYLKEKYICEKGE